MVTARMMVTYLHSASPSSMQLALLRMSRSGSRDCPSPSRMMMASRKGIILYNASQTSMRLALLWMSAPPEWRQPGDSDSFMQCFSKQPVDSFAEDVQVGVQGLPQSFQNGDGKDDGNSSAQCLSKQHAFGFAEDVQVGVQGPPQSFQNGNGQNDGGEVGLQLDAMLTEHREQV